MRDSIVGITCFPEPLPRRRERGRRTRIAALAVLAGVGTVSVALLVHPSAHAAFPGKNGRIAFNRGPGTNPQIFTIKADGSHVRRLTDTQGFNTGAAFSPTGRRIAFDRQNGIYEMHADGSRKHRLTSHSADFDPAYSPSGGQIAFVRPTAAGDEILKMHADGSHVRHLTHNRSEDTEPKFSPDGRRIAFVSDRGPGRLGIFLMRGDGSQAHRLTNSGGDPSFAPDGQRIAFVRPFPALGPKSEIFTMRLDGSHRHQLTDNHATDQQPAFSPNGKRIAFVSDRTGNREIFTMRADGSHTRRLTRTPADDAEPDWGPRPLPVRPD